MALLSAPALGAASVSAPRAVTPSASRRFAAAAVAPARSFVGFVGRLRREGAGRGRRLLRGLWRPPTRPVVAFGAVRHLVNLLVFALVASLGIASGAHALSSETALRQNFLSSAERVWDFESQACERHQENLSVATIIASECCDAARGAESAAGRVFWSGGETAKQAAATFAGRGGGTTLEMTSVGRSLESAGLPWAEAKGLWQAASRDFAAGAGGKVDVFMSKVARPDSIWTTVERGALQANPAVTGIRYHLTVVP